MIKYIGIIIYLIQITSYTFTALVNPGLVKRGMHLKYYNKEEFAGMKNFRICNLCNVIMNMDDNTFHCEECDVCIEGKNIL
jgi:hypothetical protein